LSPAAAAAAASASGDDGGGGGMIDHRASGTGDVYRNTYKGVATSLRALKDALSGGYVNFAGGDRVESSLVGRCLFSQLFSCFLVKFEGSAAAAAAATTSFALFSSPYQSRFFFLLPRTPC
jgi:hypothetical protein